MKSVWAVVVLFLLPALLLWAPPSAKAGSAGGKLTRALKSSSFKVRLQAVILIGKKKITKAAPAVRRLLEDKHDAVRAAAALTLGKLGNQKSRPNLVRLIAHPNRLVGRSAEKALILLDRKLGDPVFLVAIGPARLPEGVALSRRQRLARIFQKQLRKTSGVVAEMGESQVLSGKKLAAHLKSRNLVGMLLQPKISILKEKVGGGTTTVEGKVDMMVVSLVTKRMEFSASGEADAWIEDAQISADDRIDLENTVLDASAQAAIEQALMYLVRRAAEP